MKKLVRMISCRAAEGTKDDMLKEWTSHKAACVGTSKTRQSIEHPIAIIWRWMSTANVVLE
jgi:hypothetical protein